MLTVEIISKEIKPIAQEYNMEKVYLFGSYAKGIANEKSDVDLIVENPPKMTIVGLAGFLKKVTEALQLPVDILTLDDITEEFNKCIGEDKVLIYEK